MLHLSLCLFLPPQEATARELVEKLRSDSIEEREGAVRKLRALGKEAVPELEGVAKDPDREVAERARHLLRCVAIGDQLTAKLKKTFPGIEERLAGGGEAAYTAALLRAMTHDYAVRRFPGLGRRDLEPLVVPALRGAVSPVEKASVCRIAATFRLRSAAPAVLPLMADPETEVRGAATETWGIIGRGCWARRSPSRSC